MMTFKECNLQAFPDDAIRRGNTNAIKLERLKELFESITETEHEDNYVDAFREVVQNELKNLQQTGKASRDLEAILKTNYVTREELAERDEKLLSHQKKKNRGSVTTEADLGCILRLQCRTNDQWFENQLPGYLQAHAQIALDSETGKEANRLFSNASCEDDIQQAMNLLGSLALGTSEAKAEDSEGYLLDCSRTPLEGRTSKPDLVRSSVEERLAPHVAAVGELKYRLSRDGAHDHAAGQLVERSEQLLDDQTGRDFWIDLIAGQDQIQLFRLNAKNPLSSATNICTTPIPLSMDVHCAGFMLLWRWLCAPLLVLGFAAPRLPAEISLQDGSELEIKSKLLQNASTVAGVTGARPKVQVYIAQDRKTEEAKVVKIPRDESLFSHEVSNYGKLKKAISRNFKTHAMLSSTGTATVDGEIRNVMVLSPCGHLIQLGIDMTHLARLVIQILDLISELEKANLLHLDLGYYNILQTEEGDALLTDWQTMASKAQAAKIGIQTGTALFSSIQVLEGKGHSLCTELESLFYTMYFIVADGKLPWSARPSNQYERIGMIERGWGPELRRLVQSDSARQVLDALYSLFVIDRKYDCSRASIAAFRDILQTFIKADN